MPTRIAPGMGIPDALVDALRAPMCRPTGLPTTARFPTTKSFRHWSCGGDFGTTLSMALGPSSGLFRRHDRRGAWGNGIYAHHHLHSTAHEVLGAARASLYGAVGPLLDHWGAES